MSKSTTRKRLAIAAVLSASALLLAACSSGGTSAPTSTAATGDYKVLLETSVSGAGAGVGAAFSAAYKAGADIVNTTKGADGKTGVQGRKVVITIIDDATDPAVGVTAMQTALASGTQYDLIVPGTIGAIANAVVPTLASVDTLQMTSAPAGVDAVKYPLFFSTGVDTYLEAQSLLKKAKSAGAKHVGVLAIDNASTRLELPAYQKAAGPLGLKIDVAYVPSTTSDATPQWQQILATGADTVVLAGFDAQTAGVSLIKAKIKLQPDVKVYADISYAANGLKAAGITDSDLAGVTEQALAYLVQGTDASTSALAKTYFAAIAKESNGKTLPLVITTIGAITIALAADATVKANGGKPAAVASALSKLTDKDIPRSIGPRNPFSGGSHIQQFIGSGYSYVPMSIDTTAEGLLIPGKG